MESSRGIKQNCGCELARPYVNFQVFTRAYDISKALKRGTLFPELYLIESNNYNSWLYKHPENRVKSKKWW